MPTLIDGRQVASDSPEWRDECLARWVLLHFKGRPGLREDWLADYGKKHGQAAQVALEERARGVGRARRARRP